MCPTKLDFVPSYKMGQKILTCDLWDLDLGLLSVGESLTISCYKINGQPTFILILSLANVQCTQILIVSGMYLFENVCWWENL